MSKVKINYDCPECGSTRTKSLSLVYASGTTDVRYNSFYIGTHRNFGYVPTYGRRQTAKAKLAAPPKQREWTFVGWLFLFGIVTLAVCIFLIVRNMALPGIFLLAGWIVPSIAMAAWDHHRAETYNNTTWSSLWEDWNRSYLCERCGCIFVARNVQNGGFLGDQCSPTALLTDNSHSRRIELMDAKAKKELAENYECGAGVPKDVVRAAFLYRQAAMEGNSEALEALEVLHLVLSLDELRRIAANGDADAEAALGDRIYFDHSALTAEELQECAKWYRSSAEHGSAKGMACLARLYWRGLGVPRDLNEARR